MGEKRKFKGGWELAGKGREKRKGQVLELNLCMDFVIIYK